MMPRNRRNIICLVCGFYLLLPLAVCHMEISWPYPLRSKFDPANNWTNIDYSMTNPLFANGSNFPCKGYQNDRPIRTTVTYTAGSTYNMTLDGTATHGGGSCQISLSYDNGATFRVIKSMIGGCPLTSVFDFTVPSCAPAGLALLAWSWQNWEGNREFYMNCAEVNIIPGSTTRRRRRQAPSSFDQLPYIWKANIPGVNNCSTPEFETPVYPNPGTDVVYGGGMSSSDPPTPGSCDAPTPYGQTYVDLGDSDGPPVSSQATSSTRSESSVSNTPAPTTSSSGSAVAGNSTAALSFFPHAKIRQLSTLSAPSSTIATNDYCPGAVTITIYPSASVMTDDLAAPTTLGRVYSSSVVVDSSSVNPHGTVTITSTSTVQSSVASSTEVPAHPPYATDDVERYLPCVPGTYICTSNTAWQTCDYNNGAVLSEPANAWVYDYTRNVSAGMQCLPFLSPYAGGTSQYAQQALTPSGYYRDDKIVRARPDGDCDNDGAIQCTNGGQMFDVCDHGGWVQMGPVAAGTRCVGNGEMVASD